MLLSVLFDDEDETCVTALFQVGDYVLQLKQKPHEGRVLIKEKEEQQEQAMDQADHEPPHPSSSDGTYDSAFPNVGLVAWQSGFVLAEYLLRTQPLGPWSEGLKVLDLGCGIGQLGIALALAGAAVTLTDLEHITHLTQENVDQHVSRCAITPMCMPYMWGTPVEALRQAGPPVTGQQPQQDGQQQQQVQQQSWDAVVAADVLYEPQHYGELLNSLMQLCPQQQAEPQQQQQQPPQPGQPPQQQRPPPVYICYRQRKYDENGFEKKAAECGFEVEAVADTELHKDYQNAGYRLIRLERKQPAHQV